MSSEYLIDEILEMHKRSLRYQDLMNQAVAERADLIRKALDRSVSATAIADALDVKRPRIYAMMKTPDVVLGHEATLGNPEDEQW